MILFDTNVVLDLLFDRGRDSPAAGRLISAAERDEVGGFLCATAVTRIHYLIGREKEVAEARRALETILRIFEVASVTREILEGALSLDFDDYEDAVVHEAAHSVEAEGIVTRNVKDFHRASVPIYSPEELVGVLEARQ